MADFIEAEPSISAAGITFTYLYEQKPAVKVFLPEESSSPATFASLFWQGLGDAWSLGRFFSAIGMDMSKRGVDLAAAASGGKLLRYVIPSKEEQRIYMRVEADEYEFDFWADLKSREGGLTPEVGLAMNPSSFAFAPMRRACAILILGTAKQTPAEWEVEALMNSVTRKMTNLLPPPTSFFGAH